MCSHGCPLPSAFSAATLALYWTCGLRESTVVEMVLPTPPPPRAPPDGEVTVCTKDRALLTPHGTEKKRKNGRESEVENANGSSAAMDGWENE